MKNIAVVPFRFDLQRLMHRGNDLMALVKIFNKIREGSAKGEVKCRARIPKSQYGDGPYVSLLRTMGYEVTPAPKESVGILDKISWLAPTSARSLESIHTKMWELFGEVYSVDDDACPLLHESMIYADDAYKQATDVLDSKSGVYPQLIDFVKNQCMKEAAQGKPLAEINLAEFDVKKSPGEYFATLQAWAMKHNMEVGKQSDWKVVVRWD